MRLIDGIIDIVKKANEALNYKPQKELSIHSFPRSKSLPVITRLNTKVQSKIECKLYMNFMINLLINEVDIL